MSNLIDILRIYNTMATWKHLCFSNNVISILPLADACKLCGVSNALQSVRYAGYDPRSLIQPKNVDSKLGQLAALFKPKKKISIDEHQHDYLDRAG